VLNGYVLLESHLKITNCSVKIIVFTTENKVLVSENSYLMESLTVNKSSDSISNELGWWTVFVKKVNFFLDTDHINWTLIRIEQDLYQVFFNFWLRMINIQCISPITCDANFNNLCILDLDDIKWCINCL
jgi:hypothetical protein